MFDEMKMEMVKMMVKENFLKSIRVGVQKKGKRPGVDTWETEFDGIEGFIYSVQPQTKGIIKPGLAEILGMTRDELWERAKANGYSSYVMVALRDMWALYEDDRDEIRRFLGQELRKMEPITLKANAVSTYPLLSVNLATSQYVEDMVTASLAVNHVRKVYGNRVVSIA